MLVVQGMRRDLSWLEVGEHVLEFRQVGWLFVRADGLEAFPQGEDGGIGVSPSDGFLIDPLEDLDDGSILSAHHDGRTFGDETLGAQGRKMVANQAQQRFLAAGISDDSRRLRSIP